MDVKHHVYLVRWILSVDITEELEQERCSGQSSRLCKGRGGYWVWTLLKNLNKKDWCSGQSSGLTVKVEVNTECGHWNLNKKDVPVRAQDWQCKSRGGRPAGLPVPNKPYDLCGRRLLLLLKCCITSTETVGLLGTGAQDVHLDFHTDPELVY